MNPEIEQIHQAINNLLNTQTVLKKKPQQKKELQEKKVFIESINLIQESIIRENGLINELGINLFIYNEIYHKIIYNLLCLKFGNEITNLISFYIFDNKVKLKDEEGREVKLDTPEDLWNLIKKINSLSESKSKK